MVADPHYAPHLASQGGFGSLVATLRFVGGGKRLQSYASLQAIGADSLSTLAKKLRLDPGHRVVVLNSPPGYLDQLAPPPCELTSQLKPGETYDVVQLFVNNAEELRALGATAIRAVKPDGLLWVAYPKGGATRGATDLPATPWWTKRDVLGEHTGETGFMPVAFLKIDEIWTAVRFKKA